MNLAEYLERKRALVAAEPVYRSFCQKCRQPGFSCYCAILRPFDPRIEFAILIHPLESRRRIATGRMAHLCLEGSHLIEGHDYSDNEAVNRLIDRPDAAKVILYPGRQSLNLTESDADIPALFPPGQKLIVFVIDGTWATARQTMNISRNLKGLPRVCFTPGRPSRFRVRKQPDTFCYSTIEAIHHTIELFGSSRGFSIETGEHDRLLKAFDWLVERQLELIRDASNPRRVSGKPTWRTKSRKKRLLSESEGSF